MLTFFAVPKPFRSHVVVTPQRLRRAPLTGPRLDRRVAGLSVLRPALCPWVRLLLLLWVAVHALRNAFRRLVHGAPTAGGLVPI